MSLLNDFTWKKFLTLVFLLLITGFGSYIGILVINNIIDEPTTNENVNANTNTVKPIPSEYPDFISIKGEQKDPDIKPIIIASDYSVIFGATEGDSITYGGIMKKIKVNGTFSRIYLYFEGTIDGLPLSAFDDLYLTFNGSKGGHLISDENSLPVPPGDTSIQLYSLESISYYPTIVDKRAETRLQQNINFLDGFTDKSTIQIDVFISSERAPRNIKELGLYYECDKDDQGNIQDCSIELID